MIIGFLKIFAITFVLLAFGAGMFLMGFAQYKKIIALHHHGIVTTATVATVTRSVIDRGSNDVINNRSYEYKLEFKTQSGETKIVKWDVYMSEDYKKRHPVGSTIQIKYLPEKPETLMDANDKLFGIGFLFMMILGICLGIFAIFAFISMAKTM